MEEQFIQPRRRRTGFRVGAVAIVVLFGAPLVRFLSFALGHELHSHCVLIPLVVAYLVWLRRSELAFDESWVGAPVAGGLVTAVGGVVALAGWFILGPRGGAEIDQLSLVVFGFYLCLVGLLLGFYGWSLIRKITFPLAFGLFFVPMPSLLSSGMEEVLMASSAVVSGWVFSLSGVPVLREGQLIEIPGVVLEVAKECSGIRSTWVLLITSVLAGQLFLQRTSFRILLVAFVLPLGVLRNAIRIGVIGHLCVWRGPEMIDSWIHREGGPVFFLGSLIPLLLMLVFLRRFEARHTDPPSSLTEGSLKEA